MSGRRLIVVESNEVPPHIFRWYAEQFPASAIARLVWEGALRTTVNRDLPDLGGRELYPSQTWATLATGVPFADHGVYWYGDPKPRRFPLYWQLAATAGKRVGIVGTLHSSPLTEQANDPNIVFAIPDCFATDDATTPGRYRPFQRLNLNMTRGSGRVVAAKPGVRDLLAFVGASRLGVRPRTYTGLAKLGLGVVTKRVPRERLRTAQFVMHADIFQSLVWHHDPDLAVLFTNHVASMMHRYWYAAFPGDWTAAVYDDAWVTRYRGEITHALHLLDHVIAELRTLCDSTDRALLVVSSMGQVADTNRMDRSTETAIVRDAERFVRTLSSMHGEVRPGMVPQISIAYPSRAAASAARAEIGSKALSGLRVEVDQADEVLTITYDVDTAERAYAVDGRRWTFAEAGVEVRAIDDHRSGTHNPIGSLIALGLDLEPAVNGEPDDVLHLAPTILDALGVEPAPHHRHSLLRVEAARRA
jgi:hypothetical protein